ncbi:reverse transcriptase domain-containing protein [Picosynechococcus sp. PCC 7117]|uniref:reverse transcriptase domain-containing protein n=1 Tax=Picosynechococcus sp. PCC 7117 TaxID=195498 RepID=UPI000810DF27|nr:reverse transcriptase domain-containing protein [Picosynechococcus sp. PCC 7117]ANV88191.1 RNA-directed DNA polymerase [Picosynechococcus sp. PCC 7117]
MYLESSCERLKHDFLKLENNRELAELLNISFSRITYYVVRIPDSARYRSFQIKKRSGGFRKIDTPIKSLKIIQQKLSQVLYSVYQEKSCVHGFVVNKDIISNARAHTKKDFVLNIDLENFFGTINFGRVRGLFIGEPYNLPQDVATMIANICCYNNQLPQGAPTSPIISNMICERLDRKLQQFARKYKLFYTRYADDITLSATRKEIPSSLATVSPENRNKIELGDELQKIIYENGFSINHKKTRIAYSDQSQKVTGLIVNKTVNVPRKYIRDVRAALHDWDKNGYSKAQEKYHLKYAKQPSLQSKDSPSLHDSLRGSIEFIGHVRGRKDKVFCRLIAKLTVLKYRDLSKS